MFYLIEDEYPLNKILDILGDEFNRTCPITNLKNKSVTFIRKLEYIDDRLLNEKRDIVVLAPIDFLKTIEDYEFNGITIIFVKDVDFTFTSFHNYIYKNTRPKRNKIGRRCRIHPSAIIGVEGIKFANSPNGQKIQFIHTGDVVIKNDVDIGANSIIHRGSMDSTIIESGVKIGVMVNIGHNNIIGENTIIVGGTITSGSVKVGKNCWICAGSLIRNGVSICDNVIIGMGSMVMKDITEAGIYYGRPAVRTGDYKEDFNL